MSDNRLLKVVANRGVRPSERNKLSRFDWLQCALKLFVEEGIEAVRITRLADELSVTRGGFYWHFHNREELVDALVTFWQEKNTKGITAPFLNAESLSEGILGLFSETVAGAGFDAKLDLAIREWARRDAHIRSLLDKEDGLRIQAIQEFFSRFGTPMPEALIRARVLYFSQIGFYALDSQEPVDTRLSYTEAYFKCFSGKSLNKLQAKKFKQEVLHHFEVNK